MDSLEAVMKARFGRVPREILDRVSGMTVAQLEGALQRAATASSVDELGLIG